MSAGTGGDEVRDLLAAYALDAVDDVERRAVEQLVSQDASAAQELASLREVSAMLGVAVASAPPDSVKAAVLAGATTTPQESPHRARPTATRTEGARRRGARTPSRFGRLVVGIAAAAAVAVAVPSGLAWQERDRAVQAERWSDLLGDVLVEPGAQIVRGAVTGGGEAVAVLGAERAVLLADGLPAVPSGRTLQLWAMRDGVPVPSGLLEVTDGRVEAIAEDYRAGDGLAVSVEPDGGSAQPTTDPVLVLLPG